ncbi:MAG TPA: hemolysin family protein [Oceanobacillus sp.]|nr:hemolysin family protein [Oceanobacillus sp.]
MPLEILIIVLLAVLNGIFAMSEAAMIASRRARLQQLAERGSSGAETAIKIAEEPNRFLSTVQIFITLIGILGGAFGGATVAEEIADALRETSFAPYADALGFAIIVLFTTYISLILGELVPKRLALRSPERIASLIAMPMQMLSKLAAPIVKLLSVSTDAVLWLLGSRETEESAVTEEEITIMIQQGVETGVFEASEQGMVEGIFRLGDRRVSSLMTPRTEIVWLNLRDSREENRRKMVESGFSRFPVCDGDLDHVVGLIQAKDILARIFTNEELDLKPIVIDPIYVPESVSASKVLELFRERSLHMAFVIGEHGGLEGLVTTQDILEAIVGEPEVQEAVQRKDGSWLLDGMMTVDDVKDQLDVAELPGEYDRFETLSGFVMAQLGDVPKEGDSFEWGNYRFEVVDMDGLRVDKVMVNVIPPDETVQT